MSRLSTSATELAPSAVQTDEPSVARIIGLIGGGLTLLGTIAIIANQYGPRIITEGWGYIFTALGLVAMLFHALRDSDLEFRRAYGIFAVVLVILAIAAALVPGPIFAKADSELLSKVTKIENYHFLPWSPLLGLLGLMFLVVSQRHETDQTYLGYALLFMLSVGAILCLGSVVVGMIWPATLLGKGLLLSVLGLGFIAAFLSFSDSNEGTGYLVAVSLGVVGGAALVYAIARAVVPTVLFDGPAVLKTPFQTYDPWRVTARVSVILMFVGVAVAMLFAKGWAGWLRGGIAILAAAFAGLFVFGTFANPVTVAPQPYLVPSGLILAGIGLLYICSSLSMVSDSVLVTLTRRELSSSFYSPIAYLVMLGVAIVAWLGYAIFASQLLRSGGQPVPEPILPDYWGATIGGAFSIVFLIPVITMRAFSEEKRTGTLELLLTAPVNEPAVVLSKFLGTWLFFMFAWLPVGLYLIALNSEIGTFDYRPLLSYYAAMGACGAGFVAMGIFFSSLTTNQIIAAVLTFSGMFFMLLTLFAASLEFIPNTLRQIISKFDYFSLWQQALGGQLPLSNVLVHLSLAVFWLFLTTKVLEARKWN